MSVSCECCVLSRIDLCEGPIPRLEEYHRLCASLSVIRRNNKPLHLKRVGRRCQGEKGRSLCL